MKNSEGQIHPPPSSFIFTRSRPLTPALSPEYRGEGGGLFACTAGARHPWGAAVREAPRSPSRRQLRELHRQYAGIVHGGVGDEALAEEADDVAAAGRLVDDAVAASCGGAVDEGVMAGAGDGHADAVGGERVAARAAISAVAGRGRDRVG